jgi:universal stress protein E
MAKLNCILAVASPRHQLTPAVHRAAEYARRSGAVLHVCLFDSYAPIDMSQKLFGIEVAGRARRDFVEEHMSWLAQQAAALAGHGLRVECDVVWAPAPHEAILAKVLEIGADLVIKDVDRSNGVLHPSSADWKLLRLCPVTLMLVQPDARLLPQSMLAAVDLGGSGLSPFNDRILATAQDIAALSQATVDLASVFAYVPIESFGTGYVAETYEIMDRTHKEALAAFAARHALPAARIHRFQGFDTADTLAQAAQQLGADLVAIGSAYHTGLDRFLLGTTAEGLLRRLGCDVLLIKPEGFVSELARHVDLAALAQGHKPPEAQPAG